MLPTLLSSISLISSLVVFAMGREKPHLIERFSPIVLFVQLVLAGFIAFQVAWKGTLEVGRFFYVDALGAILLFIVTFIGFTSALYSFGYLRHELHRGTIGLNRIWKYHSLFHAFLFSMIIAITTASPMLMWVAVEATTLATAFLVSYYNRPLSMEAAWKYLIVNSAGLLMGLLGMFLLMASAVRAGAGETATWSELLHSGLVLDPLMVHTAFIFIVVGFGTKAGLAPMHTWLPDAHGRSPAPISAMLSGVLLNVSLLAILRAKAFVDLSGSSEFTGNILIGFGLLSIAIVSFTLLSQRHYKRLLAYSSVENMGIIALGIGLGGIATFGALMHLLYHALAKPLLFLSSGNIFMKYGSTLVEDVRGAFTTIPRSAFVFFAGFLAVSGMPPFGTFMTKFTILSALFARNVWLGIITLLLLVVVFAGFFRHFSSMVFGKPSEGIKNGEEGFSTGIPLALLLSALLVISWYLPETLRVLTQSATDFISPTNIIQ